LDTRFGGKDRLILSKFRYPTEIVALLTRNEQTHNVYQIWQVSGNENIGKQLQLFRPMVVILGAAEGPSSRRPTPNWWSRLFDLCVPCHLEMKTLVPSLTNIQLVTLSHTENVLLLANSVQFYWVQQIHCGRMQYHGQVFWE
jgi:hypothetical protein